MVDLVNALNAGSGVDVKALAKSLTEAARAPQQKALDDKKAVLEAKVSSVGKVMSVVNEFELALQSFGDPRSFHKIATSSDPSKVALEFTDTTNHPNFTSQVSVTALAVEPSLIFPPLSSLNAPVSGLDANRKLTLVSGTSAAPGDTLASIDLEQIADLPSLRDKINTLDGFTATIIQGGSASSPLYYLSVKRESGASNTFHAAITKTVANVTTNVTSGDGLILNGNERLTAGADASIAIDGITVTSTTNDFNDILPGIKITALGLTSATPATISTKTDPEKLSAAVATYVSGFNLMISTINTETKFSTDPKARGGLSNDPSTRALLAELRRFSTQPIEGYGSSSFTLAQIGVKTNKDGSLTLDETVFAKTLKNNPTMVESLFASKKSVSDSRLNFLSATSKTQPGEYVITKSDASSWTINGQAATLEDQKLTASDQGNAAGLSLFIPYDVSSQVSVGFTAKVNYAKGFVERLLDMSKTLKETTSPIQSAASNATSELKRVADLTAKLDDRMKKMEERYNAQFTLMNTMVNEANNTKASLKTFIESWTNSLKG